MKLTKTWTATRAGLHLHMDLTIEGETLSVTSVQQDDLAHLYRSPPPAYYVEREMRRELMQALETRIFGDSK
jgi:hypothetical protein